MLIALIGIVLGCLLVGTVLQIAFLLTSGNDISSLASGDIPKPHLRLLLFITQITTFLIPALIFGYLYFKRRLWEFFGFHKGINYRWIFFCILMLLVLLPLIQYSYQINQSFPLPDWMIAMEDEAARTLEAIVTMNSPGELIINLALIALLPAISEELLFRGAIQQLGYKFFNSKWISVWVTAIIFSAIHFQFEGFIPRFILGLYLGYLFYWTGNILVPIFGHFFNNGLMIVLSYFKPELITDVDQTPVPDLPWYAVLAITALIFPLVMYFRNEYTSRLAQIPPEARHD